MKTSQKERSAGAVIFSKDTQRKYLLLHYSEGHWDFPKGHIEKGESEEQTALREIKEETGITGITFIGGFKENLHYFYTFNKAPIFKSVVFYLAQADKADVILSFEHIGFVWLPYKEALIRLTYKNAKEILKNAETFLDSKQ